MNKIISFIAIISILPVLFSCQDKDEVYEIRLNETEIELDKAEMVFITIESGNGRYQATSSNSAIVKVVISGTTIALYGVEGGSAEVVITDQLGKNTKLNVDVKYSAPNTPTFKWNNEGIDFDKSRGYGISMMTSSIALTNIANIANSKQFLISWEGGFAEGEKQNGKLTIVKPNSEGDVDREDIDLTTVRIGLADPFLGYYIVFSDGSKSGELFFYSEYDPIQ